MDYQIKRLAKTPKKQFDNILSKQNFENSPGFVALVAKNDRVIYRKAFGYANLELNAILPGTSGKETTGFFF